MTQSGFVKNLSAALDDAPPQQLDNLRQAAVLVLLDYRQGEPEVILTRRADHLRLHAGEVAFPGGKCDPEDRDHWHTALREAEEEIELPAAAVQPLGVMPALVTRTEYEVVPCVALLRRQVVMKPNPEELDSIFTVPLSYLAQPGRLQLDEVLYRGRLRLVPRFEYDEYSIWGVTAAMLVKLVNITCDAGLVVEDYWKGEEQ